MSVYTEVRSRLKKALPAWLQDDLIFATTKSGKLAESFGDEISSVKAISSDGNARGEVEPQDALLYASKRPETQVYPFSRGEAYYRLFLDLDLPAIFLPSSTEGHGHLVVDAWLTKDQHDAILETLAEAGIVQRGYAESGINNELGSTLRLPWVKKGEDQTLTQQLTTSPVLSREPWAEIVFD